MALAAVAALVLGGHALLLGEAYTPAPRRPSDSIEPVRLVTAVRNASPAEPGPIPEVAAVQPPRPARRLASNAVTAPPPNPPPAPRQSDTASTETQAALADLPVVRPSIEPPASPHRHSRADAAMPDASTITVAPPVTGWITEAVVYTAATAGSGELAQRSRALLSGPSSQSPGEADVPPTLLRVANPASPALPAATAGLAVTPLAPPSVWLKYKLQRGILQGSGTVEWRHEANRYSLKLDAQVSVLGRFFSQQSDGGFDASGVAPVRYTERRIGRSERAINFVRPTDGSAARIAFSARTDSVPLRPGAQDRLSWMAQLASVLAGVRSPPVGTTIGMDVAGVGGDVRHWLFVLQRVEADGSQRWMRTPENERDMRVDVTTDPARQHWPSRVQLAEGDGDPLELTLQEMRALVP